MFIGRKNELNEIQNGLNTDRFESFLIYGRRRIGKTELINEGIKNYDGLVIIYECIKSSVSDNINLFTKKLVDIFKDDYIHFLDFKDLLSYVFEKSLTRKIVLVIDEFSFLLEEDPSIESRLAATIDHYKHKTNLKLFISGSYVSLMEKMIEYNSHSYGRFTHIMLLKQFDYFDSSLFYPNYSNEDKIMMYSVIGGIPFFNSLIDSNKPALENIYNLIIKKDSILEHEIKEMILNETNKISNLNYLITTISKGVCKYKDITNNMLSIGCSKPDYLLSKLIDMNIVKRTFPINDENNKKRITYEFSDNLLHFYYKYIFYTPYQEFRSNPEFFFNEFIRDDFLKSYLPYKFERISSDFLIKKNYNYEIKPTILKIGKYSYDDSKNKINREFDLVTFDKNGYIAYECKYTNSLIDNKIIEEEILQSKDLDIEFYKFGFISKSGFSSKIDKEKYNCYELNDFYNFK